jgi:hypothetical protein
LKWRDYVVRMKRRRILVSIAVLIGVYLVIAISPLTARLGRYSPDAASFLSPPFMNFSARYFSGEVVGFRIGMSREDLVADLRERLIAGHAKVRKCGTAGSPKILFQSNAQPYDELTAVATCICAYVGPGGRTVLIILLTNGHVSEIEVARIRTELI